MQVGSSNSIVGNSSHLFLDVFSAQGPLSDIGVSHVKLVRREHCKALRCSVLSVEGDTTRVHLPRGWEGPGLRLPHPLLVLQLKAGGPLTTLELLLDVTHGTHSHVKRVTLTPSSSSPHVRGGNSACYPLSLPRDAWSLLVIDLPRLVSSCFGSYTFRSVEGVSLQSWCLLCRIFVTKAPVTDGYYAGNGCIPKAFDFPEGTVCRVVRVPPAAVPVSAPLGQCFSVCPCRRSSGADALEDFIEASGGQQQPPLQPPTPPRAETTPHPPWREGFQYPHHPADWDLRRPISVPVAGRRGRRQQQQQQQQEERQPDPRPSLELSSWAAHDAFVECITAYDPLHQPLTPSALGPLRTYGCFDNEDEDSTPAVPSAGQE